MALDKGDVIGGRYQLNRFLNAGGMGQVWEARDTKLNRVVAVKVGSAHGPNGQVLQERFRREALIGDHLGKLDGFVRVLDWGVDGSKCWMSMDLIRDARPLELCSGSLDERLDRVREAARLLQQAHAEGVVHRDVKPDNYLVGSDGRIYLGDFGLSRAPLGLPDFPEAASTLTVSSLGGTPGYICPEQVNDPHSVDASGDVFSIGVMLFVALAGSTSVLPYGTSLNENLQRYWSGATPVDPRSINPEAPRSLCDFCLRCLSLKREQRPSIDELILQLSPLAVLPVPGRLRSSEEEAETDEPEDSPDAVVELAQSLMNSCDRATLTRVARRLGFEEIPSDDWLLCLSIVNYCDIGDVVDALSSASLAAMLKQRGARTTGDKDERAIRLILDTSAGDLLEGTLSSLSRDTLLWLATQRLGDARIRRNMSKGEIVSLVLDEWHGDFVLENLRVKDLKQALSSKGLPTSGTHIELRCRLVFAIFSFAKMFSYATGFLDGDYQHLESAPTEELLEIATAGFGPAILELLRRGHDADDLPEQAHQLQDLVRSLDAEE